MELPPDIRRSNKQNYANPQNYANYLYTDNYIPHFFDMPGMPGMPDGRKISLVRGMYEPLTRGSYDIQNIEFIKRLNTADGSFKYGTISYSLNLPLDKDNGRFINKQMYRQFFKKT